MTIGNLVNMIANITAKELDVTRQDIERPYVPTENASEARAVIAKVAVSFGIPISAIRRIINRNENLTMYYLAHEAREHVVREVKRKTQFYLDQLQNIRDINDYDDVDEMTGAITEADILAETEAGSEADTGTETQDNTDTENGPS